MHKFCLGHPILLRPSVPRSWVLAKGQSITFLRQLLFVKRCLRRRESCKRIRGRRSNVVALRDEKEEDEKADDEEDFPTRRRVRGCRLHRCPQRTASSSVVVGVSEQVALEQTRVSSAVFDRNSAKPKYGSLRSSFVSRVNDVDTSFTTTTMSLLPPIPYLKSEYIETVRTLELLLFSIK